MKIIHMSQAALDQIKSGFSFLEKPMLLEKPIMHYGHFLCGIPITSYDAFIGNSDIGSNGNIISSADNKKVTCPGCIKVLKENSL